MRQRGISAFVVLASFLVSCNWEKPQRTPPDSTSARLEDYNVVVILVDTLRADHLGLYGYGRDTSPFLDSLGNGGIVFEEAYSSSSYTREAISALFTAEYPALEGKGRVGKLFSRFAVLLAMFSRSRA